MRRWGRQISKLWKRKAVFQIWPWPWPGKVNPAMHRPLQSWADEASDERCCFGLPVTSENFPGLRAKLYMEICCKWAVLMWLGRLWILPYAGALRKCECSYFSLTPYNIINSNVIWKRFAATLNIWYLWHLANFPPGFANCGHSWLVAQQLSINNQTWTERAQLSKVLVHVFGCRVLVGL